MFFPSRSRSLLQLGMQALVEPKVSTLQQTILALDAMAISPNGKYINSLPIQIASVICVMITGGVLQLIHPTKCIDSMGF